MFWDYFSSPFRNLFDQESFFTALMFIGVFCNGYTFGSVCIYFFTEAMNSKSVDCQELCKYKSGILNVFLKWTWSVMFFLLAIQKFAEFAAMFKGWRKETPDWKLWREDVTVIGLCYPRPYIVRSWERTKRGFEKAGKSFLEGAQVTAASMTSVEASIGLNCENADLWTETLRLKKRTDILLARTAKLRSENLRSWDDLYELDDLQLELRYWQTKLSNSLENLARDSTIPGHNATAEDMAAKDNSASVLSKYEEKL